MHKNLRNSIAGIKIAISDNSFKGQIALGVLTIPMIVLWGRVSTGYKLMAVATYVFLIAIELLNTAIERLCDRVTKEHDQAIKEVKDMSSAAVFVVLMLFLAQCGWILVTNP